MTLAEKPAAVGLKEQVDQILTMVTALTESQEREIAAKLLEQVGQLSTKTQELHAKTTQMASTFETIGTQIASKVAEAMVEQPPPSGDMALLLADCRDTITEGIGALHTQGADVLHALQILQAPPAKPVRPKQPLWLAGGVGLAGGMVLMGATWWVWPDGGYWSFLVGLDAVLVKHHPQLPAPVQDAVAAVYGRYQFQTPGSRQKGK